MSLTYTLPSIDDLTDRDLEKKYVSLILKLHGEFLDIPGATHSKDIMTGDSKFVLGKVEELRKEKKAVNAITVKAAMGAMLASNGKPIWEEVLEWIKQLDAEVPVAERESTCKVVNAALVDLTLRRGYIQNCLTVMQAAANRSTPINEVGEKVKTLAFGIVSDFDNVPQEIITLASGVKNRIDSGKPAFTAIPTGNACLDAFIHGSVYGGVNVLAGRPGEGKSTVVMDLVVRTAQQDDPRTGKPAVVCLFSYEMAGQNLAAKIMGRQSGENAKTFMFGRGDHAREKAAEAVKSLEGLPIYVVDKPRGIADMVVKMNMVRAMAGRDISLVVVDYLQLIPPDIDKNRRVTRHEEIATMMRELHQLSAESDCAIWVLSQFNRSREGQVKPTLYNLAESGGIEANATAVVAIGDIEPAHEQGWYRTTFHVLKSRYGSTGDYYAMMNYGQSTVVNIRQGDSEWEALKEKFPALSIGPGQTPPVKRPAQPSIAEEKATAHDEPQREQEIAIPSTPMPVIKNRKSGSKGDSAMNPFSQNKRKDKELNF